MQRGTCCFVQVAKKKSKVIEQGISAMKALATLSHARWSCGRQFKAKPLTSEATQILACTSDYSRASDIEKEVPLHSKHGARSWKVADCNPRLIFRQVEPGSLVQALLTVRALQFR